MLPVKLGSVIAATTPIIVNDSNISAIVNADRKPTDPLWNWLSQSAIVKAIRRPQAHKPFMALDSFDLPPVKFCATIINRCRICLLPSLPFWSQRRHRPVSSPARLAPASRRRGFTSAKDCPPPPEQNARTTRVFSF